MSKQNLNYEDGIPEEILWNPETNSFMKRSLFPGKWIPARISVWDADNPKYQYRPGRDRTYQEAMKSISGNSIPGDRSERQDYRDSRGNFSLSMLSEGQKIVRIPAMPVKVLPGKPHKFRFRRTIKKARNIMVGMY